MDGDVQPPGRRPRDTRPLPVLVLPVRLGQPDRAVGAAPARGADRGRGAARPRGEGSRPASDDPDRAQSGGAPGQDAGHQHRGSALERGQPQAAGGVAVARRDPRSVPPRTLPRAIAHGVSRHLHLHPASRELRGRPARPRQPHPAALDPALRPHGGGGRRQPKPGRLESRVRPVGGRQHVAGAPLHPGSAGDPRRPVRHGQLHHRRRGGRAGRAGRRWRGQVRRRPHRAGRVRAGREVEPFHAGQSPHHRGGPPHSAAARRSEDGHGPAASPDDTRKSTEEPSA